MVVAIRSESEAKQALVAAAVHEGYILAADIQGDDGKQMLSDGQKLRLRQSSGEPEKLACQYWRDAVAISIAVLRVDDKTARKALYDAGQTAVKMHYVADVSARIRNMLSVPAAEAT